MLERSRRLGVLACLVWVGCGGDPGLPPHRDAGPTGDDGPAATGGTTGEGGGGMPGRGGTGGAGAGGTISTGGAGGLPGMGGMPGPGGAGGMMPPPMGGMGGMMPPPMGGGGGVSPPPMGGVGGTMMPPVGGMTGSGGAGGVSCGSAMCQAGQVCCPAGLPCANMCVPDCRLGGGSCPMAGLTCSQSSGVCTPSGMGGMGGMTMPPMGGMGGMGGMTMPPMGGMGTGGSTGGTGGSSSACRTDTFVDLTAWLPDQNAAYEDPTLSVSCSGSAMTVVSNSVPQYKITWADSSRHSFANTLVPSSSTYTIPRTTVFNAVPKQATVVGGVGVAVNGIQISSPSASGGPLQYADPAGTEIDSDTCEGHPNPSGHYHYHSLKPSCLFKDAENGDLVGSKCTKASPIVGWIADGYPMYGPCECLDAACTQVVEMRSSWKLQGGDNNPRACAYQDYQYVGDASGEESDGDKFLDQCNGHYGPKGDYHYHMTNEYPWTLRCYRGTPMATMTAGHTYNAAAGGNDCCFEKECKSGVYQSGLNCQAMSCVP